MTPNQITSARVVAAFAAVGFFLWAGGSIAADLAALALIVAAIALDGLDGYLARRKNLATAMGAQFDILGDRIVENLLFTFFATGGLVTLWVPVFFFVRGTITDFFRSFAARSGRSGFGRNGMHETWWGRALVASRPSRAAYAALKCICFCYLGAEWSLTHASAFQVSARAYEGISHGSRVLVGTTVAFCFVRAIPVLWEGRRFFSLRSSAPRSVPRLARRTAGHAAIAEAAR
jgi:phosphatidylglycerophosphate synthase